MKLKDGILVELSREELEQLENDRKRLEEKERLTGYKIARAEEYPNIGDQLDAIWKYLNTKKDDLSDDVRGMLVHIMDVKDKYPKPQK